MRHRFFADRISFELTEHHFLHPAAVSKTHPSSHQNLNGIMPRSTLLTLEWAVIAIASTLLLHTLSEPVTVKDCSGRGETPVVDISPCPSEPCVFPRGITANVSVVFTAPADSSTLTSHIYGYIAGIKVPWSMPNPDGCKDSGLTCPIKGGFKYTYLSTLSAPRDAPQVAIVVEWDLIGSNGEKFFCFDFPLEIVGN